MVGMHSDLRVYVMNIIINKRTHTQLVHRNLKAESTIHDFASALQTADRQLH